MCIYRLIFELFKPEHCNDHYLKRYLKLIEIYKNRDLKKKKGFHSHHILPKHFNGGESSKNKVVVSPREHFILHWILYKTFPMSGMTIAFFGMCNGFSHYGFRVISRVYEQLSIAHSKRMSKPKSAEHRQKVIDAQKGRTRSLETRQRMSDSHKGIPSPLKGVPKKGPSPLKDVPKSADTRQRMKDAMKERWRIRKLNNQTTKQGIDESHKPNAGTTKTT